MGFGIPIVVYLGEVLEFVDIVGCDTLISLGEAHGP